ncbi:MAG: hypothetical protein D6834_00510 [Aquificota bacterium]|nr:MAG: hypothetical protein D6834_00510 [Aquificota bacterium]
MWKDVNPATQKRQPIEYPHYKEETWWVASDIKEEIRKMTGKYISLVKIGKIAKENNMVKDSGKGFKLYHKDLIPILIDFVNYYYGGEK